MVDCVLVPGWAIPGIDNRQLGTARRHRGADAAITVAPITPLRALSAVCHQREPAATAGCQ